VVHVHTHNTCMHLCIHIHTHAHSHTHTRTLTRRWFKITWEWVGCWAYCGSESAFLITSAGWCICECICALGVCRERGVGEWRGEERRERRPGEGEGGGEERRRRGTGGRKRGRGEGQTQVLFVSPCHTNNEYTFSLCVRD